MGRTVLRSDMYSKFKVCIAANRCFPLLDKNDKILLCQAGLSTDLNSLSEYSSFLGCSKFFDIVKYFCRVSADLDLLASVICEFLNEKRKNFDDSGCNIIYDGFIKGLISANFCDEEKKFDLMSRQKFICDVLKSIRTDLIFYGDINYLHEHLLAKIFRTESREDIRRLAQHNVSDIFLNQALESILRNIPISSDATCNALLCTGHIYIKKGYVKL